MENMVTLVSSVGFPIASWIMLAWYIYKVQSDTTKALNNNTRAILKLCDKLNIESDEVIEND